MKFVIARDDLLKAIGSIQSTVSQKPVIPLLSNFLLEANDELTLMATDLTVSIRCFLHAKIFEKGSTTLPARKFFQLIKEITNPQIEIRCDSSNITEITTERSKFKLNGMDRNEFPSLPDFKDQKSIIISQGQLRELFFRTSFAISKDENRMVLTGLLIQMKNGVLTMVGTDGKRLAKAEYSKSIDSALDGKFVVPNKAIEEMSKILRDSEEQATLEFVSDKLALETESVRLVSRLLNGDFPNFENVIPKKLPIQILLDRDELASALRQVSLFTSESSLSVKFMISNGELLLQAVSHSVGECSISIAVHYHGPGLEISFNPIFVLDVLRHCTSSQIWVCLCDAYTPGIIKDSENSTYVLMPMRVPNA